LYCGNADLLEELIKCAKQTNALLEELLDLQIAPRRVIRDDNDEIVGSEIADED